MKVMSSDSHSCLLQSWPPDQRFHKQDLWGPRVGGQGECTSAMGMEHSCILNFFFFLILIKKNFLYWSIGDLQCFRYTAKWFSYTYVHVYILFSYYFLL